MPDQVPQRIFYGESMSSVIAHLRKKDAVDNGRSILGFRLPDWQRPSVWTDYQCERFIQSVYRGAVIGNYIVNESDNPELDNLIIDGQQRLRAIERYWDDEIALSGNDGALYCWSDLTSDSQARFLRIQFPWTLMRINDEALLREAYNIHNFSGTPHTADQFLEDAKSYSEGTVHMPK